MGFLDNLKDKAEEFGDKAKEGFEAAKDKASDLVDDVKDRFDGDETAGDQPASEDKVEDAVDYSPGSLDEASQEAPGAVAEATAAAEASAAPASDPLDPVDPVAESVDTDVTPVGEEDPLDGGAQPRPRSDRLIRPGEGQADSTPRPPRTRWTTRHVPGQFCPPTSARTTPPVPVPAMPIWRASPTGLAFVSGRGC